MKITFRIFFCFIVCFCCLSSGIAQQQAIVGIYADLGSVSGQGTGFFISNKGRILTAYHVIKGARKIQVYHNGREYQNVVVEAIAPNYDLAIIRIENLSITTPYLIVTKSFPPNNISENLKVIGYARGIPNQVFNARLTQDSYLNSGQIRGLNHERLFSFERVSLIPLDVTIYNGLSGAPLVFNQYVYGVLSGSLNEGGSIAWAIPSNYTDFMNNIEKRPEQIFQWEPISLMSDGWKNLRKVYQRDPRLTQATDAYFKALEDYANILSSIPNVAYQARTSFYSDKQYIEYLLSLPVNSSEIRLAIVNGMIFPDETEASFLRYVVVSEEEDLLRSQFREALVRLKRDLDVYFNSLDRSWDTYHLLEEYIAQTENLKNRLSFEKQNELAHRMNRATLRTRSIIVNMKDGSTWDNNKQRQYLLDYLAIVSELESLLMDHSSEDIIEERINVIDSYRSYGKLIEQIIFQE